MSLTHCIRTLIDLKDKNIPFPENYCEERVIKGRRTKLIYATLTYKLVCCTRCGCLNTQFSVVKNGFPTYLVLKKNAFYVESATVVSFRNQRRLRSIVSFPIE